MYYRTNPKNQDALSQLGYGCMRFPHRGAQIDQDRATELIRAAVDQGVNYFDTAYIYSGSEEAVGKAIETIGCRDKIYLATKLPIILVRKAEDFDRFFDIQRKRLRTDTIDYYLMHMLQDKATWDNLTRLGIQDWLAAKRAAGQIRNVGFSFHGGQLAFKALVDAHPWDFCMVQFNYLDEHKQAGIDGIQYASQRGLPVFVMEPLRGGQLAVGLPDEAKAAFSAVDPDRGPAEWGLRWVWNHPEVTLALSGMSDMAQLTGNLRAAETARPNLLTEPEFAAYAQAVSAILGTTRVPCTGCGYCQPCPKGVDIPTCFACYNESYSGRRGSAMIHYYTHTGGLTPAQHDAAKCVRCGKCEAHCPQHIEIMNELEHVRRRMHSGVCNPVFSAARAFMRVNTKASS
jgi:predicted aldo/keto reductase-like oxidoreductase